MSYRCKKCNAAVKIHTPMYKIIEYREVIDEVTKRVRKEIKKETAACPDCYETWQKAVAAEEAQNVK